MRLVRPRNSFSSTRNRRPWKYFPEPAKNDHRRDHNRSQWPQNACQGGFVNHATRPSYQPPSTTQEIINYFAGQATYNRFRCCEEKPLALAPRPPNGGCSLGGESTDCLPPCTLLYPPFWPQRGRMVARDPQNRILRSRNAIHWYQARLVTRSATREIDRWNYFCKAGWLHHFLVCGGTMKTKFQVYELTTEAFNKKWNYVLWMEKKNNSVLMVVFSVVRRCRTYFHFLFTPSFTSVPCIHWLCLSNPIHVLVYISTSSIGKSWTSCFRLGCLVRIRTA